MKIGIITLTPLTTNYGGILQAFALQQVLKRKGHEVVTIDFKWKFIKADNLFKTFLRLGKRWYMNNVETRIRTCKTRTFLRNITQECVYLDSIKECDYDIYVVGSDQVWRPIYWAKKDFAIIPFGIY
ncbi:polysaccharide pyruvyl transferase family protein [Bacteroides sp. CR5/BHMF/2]|nr:polysaccharide pyruvyl transferase family protein [Bacteroides sp. CR5/BHMF/2]